MLHDLAHLANLGLHFLEIARHRELGKAKAFLLQKFARRSLVKQARHNDIGPQHQYVFGTSRQNPVPVRVVGRPGFKPVARIAAETEDLLRIGQRYQQLIGTYVHRGDARQGCREHRRNEAAAERRKSCDGDRSG